MNAFVAFAFAAVCLLHLLPAVGVLGPDQLQALYGFPMDERDLLLLMRHRAAMFGMIGALLLVAAWRPSWRPAAGFAGLASMLSFVALALPPADYSVPLTRVFWADVLGSALLALALVAARRAQ